MTGVWPSLPACALALLAAAPPAQSTPPVWRHHTMCGQPMPPFTHHPDPASPCPDEAYCTSLDANTRVCACLDDRTAASNNTTFTLAHRGVIQQTWMADLSSITYGPDAFRLDAVGMSPAGVPQFLMGAKTGQSNGMAIESWSLWLISAGQVSAPLHLEDYGLMSFATRTPPSPHCELLASHWQPGAQGGLYVVGRWYNLTPDGFKPAPHRPVVSRRYRASLERQRDAHREAARALRW